MTWVRIDAAELTRAGQMLRDAGSTIAGIQGRLAVIGYAPGLGRMAAQVTGEGAALAQQANSLADGYLRLAVDVLQRALAALRDASLPSLVTASGVPAVVGSPWSPAAVMSIGGATAMPGPVQGVTSASGALYSSASTTVGGWVSPPAYTVSFDPSRLPGPGSTVPNTAPAGRLSGNPVYDSMAQRLGSHIQRTVTAQMDTLGPSRTAETLKLAADLSTGRRW